MAGRTRPLPSTRHAPRLWLGIYAMAGLTVVLAACSPALQRSGPVGTDPHDELGADTYNLLDPVQQSMEATSDRPTDDSAGWITQGNADIGRSTEAAAEGRSSLKVVGSDSDPIYVDNTRTVRVATTPVSVTAGHTYEGRVKVMSPAERSPVRCELRWYDADGKIMDTAAGRAITEAPGAWANPSCRATAPGGAASGALRVHLAKADVTDVHFVDEAFLIDISTNSVGETPTSSSVPPSAAPTIPAPSAPTTTAPPMTTAPGGAPTSASVGPRTTNPQNVGRIEVNNGDDVTLTDVVASSIYVRSGGKLTATNVRVTGGVYVMPTAGAPIAKLHLTNSAVHKMMTVNVHDASGNLYWGGNVPVDVKVTGSWLHYPQGSGTDHTEALAGFGWPSGATFTNTTFVQSGPYNNTATATINWHGANTIFDGCHFLWESGTAAYFTVYVTGANNLVRNSQLQRGLAGYVFPDSNPKATYTNNVDATTGKPI